MFEIVYDDDGRTDAGPWVSYKLTYEPNGSGELKTSFLITRLIYEQKQFHLDIKGN